jgi:ketosteroid isomerase-like protein
MAMPEQHIVAAGRSVAPAEVPAPVREYFAALNAEDLPRLEQTWSAGAELRAVGSRPRRGRDEVMAYFRPLFEPWAEHLDQPTRVIVADDTAVVEVHFTGRTHAGHELVFDAIDVFELAGGRIERLSTWYDLVWLRKQLA